MRQQPVSPSSKVMLPGTIRNSSPSRRLPKSCYREQYETAARLAVFQSHVTGNNMRQQPVSPSSKVMLPGTIQDSSPSRRLPKSCYREQYKTAARLAVFQSHVTGNNTRQQPVSPSSKVILPGTIRDSSPSRRLPKSCYREQYETAARLAVFQSHVTGNNMRQQPVSPSSKVILPGTI